MRLTKAYADHLFRVITVVALASIAVVLAAGFIEFLSPWERYMVPSDAAIVWARKAMIYTAEYALVVLSGLLGAHVVRWIIVSEPKPEKPSRVPDSSNPEKQVWAGEE